MRPAEGREDPPLARRPSRRTFGLIEERKSPVAGTVTSVRARYTGPDTEKHHRSFGDKAAEAWLNAERILIDRGEVICDGGMSYRDVACEWPILGCDPPAGRPLITRRQPPLG